MSASRDAILARRRELIARSDAHRAEITRAAQVWRGPLDKLDRAVTVIGQLSRHAPWLMGGMAAIWMATRGKNKKRRSRSTKLPGLLGTAQTAWRVAQTVAGVTSSLRRGAGWMI